MANSVTLSSLGLLGYGEVPKTSIANQRRGTYVSGSSSSFSEFGLWTRGLANQIGGRRYTKGIKKLNYFRSPSRKALLGGIFLLGGFYAAQTISLPVGALAVNDVFAAVLCVLITEYITRFYHSRPKVTFPVAHLNNFKTGFTQGLLVDAFKFDS